MSTRPQWTAAMSLLACARREVAAGALQGVRVREGRGSGVRATRNGGGGAGVALAYVVGAESTTCVRVLRADGWGDGSDRQGPRVNGRERVNGQSALTGRTHLTEGEAGARERGDQHRQAGPTGNDRRQRVLERDLVGADKASPLGRGEHGGGWASWAERPMKRGSWAV
jgi:hypothetical protein